MFESSDPSSLIESINFSDVNDVRSLIGAVECVSIDNTKNKQFAPCLGNLVNLNGFLTAFRLFEKCRAGLDPFFVP